MYSEDIKTELISRLATYQVEYDLLLIESQRLYSSDARKEKMIELKELIIFYQKEIDKI